MNSKYVKMILLVLAGALVIMIVLGFIFMDRIIMYYLARSYDLNITYDKIIHVKPGELEFDGLRVISNKADKGFVSKRSKIYPRLTSEGIAIVFKLYDVQFTGKDIKSLPIYDTLPGLVDAPFKSLWLYDEISGSLRITREGIAVNDFSAKGSMFKISFSGSLYKDDTVALDIVIYFSDQLTSKVPNGLSGVLLRNEPEGWKSLAVTLKGDLKTPAIQVTGKLFKLSIGTVSSSK